jgi:multicomponent Na+:H+ antiporter subunit G
MELILDIASGALLAAGSAFILIGTLGLVRLPDFYTRLHAAGITDTLGAELLLIAMMLQAGLSLITVKLILISLFVFFTSPTATHAVANAARTMGLRPALVPDSDIEPPRDDAEGMR